MGMMALAGCAGHQDDGREVVVYTSLDQRLSEPILARFSQETGIEARAVYDTEATKTAGLVNRLIAEKNAPRADVFWNSEIVRTIVLAKEGVLAPYESPASADVYPQFKDPGALWTGFAGRVRVLGVRPEQLPRAEWPDRFEDLAREDWRGRFAMAYPLFGTTSFHAAALFDLLGPGQARSLLSRVADNDPEIVDGNSTARDMVVSGAVPVCWTDSDDVAVAQRRGSDISMIVPSVKEHGPLLIPNTVALIAGGPNPAEARELIDYLLSRPVEEALAAGPGAQIPLRPEMPWPDPVPRFDVESVHIDYRGVAEHLDEAMAFCRKTFVR
jgi:iron(III) transport system substrate-binding protein